ncbi:MAG: hypothetical protein K6B46_05540 [Opitutales bacterium]|nr:hypothetical protein [Opitutales bacterium]
MRIALLLLTLIALSGTSINASVRVAASQKQTVATPDDGSHLLDKIPPAPNRWLPSKQKPQKTNPPPQRTDREHDHPAPNRITPPPRQNPPPPPQLTERDKRRIKAEKCHGRIRVVSAFGDFKVKIDPHFADLNVRETPFASQVGEWTFVDAGEDFTVEFVEHFEDFSIRYSPFPGLN